MFYLYLEYLKLQASQNYISLYIVLFAISWLFFIVRFLPGVLKYRREKEVDLSKKRTEGFGVIIPVVDEPFDIFENVLGNIAKYAIDKDTVVIIQNGKTNSLGDITQKYGFKFIHTPIPSKRNAIILGLNHITQKNTILVDSDSIWHTDCFSYFLKEFEDPKVGGVTSNQFIPEENVGFQARVVNRYALMLEYVRNTLSFRSQSVFGQIGCLPGRTIAFRTSIIKDAQDEFLNDYFLGHKIEFSDDRFLTNKALLSDYKTVYCHEAIVETNAPETIGKYYKQQMRWARGSQINNLRTIFKYIKKNLWYVTLIFFIDTILPFMWLGFMIGGVLQGVIDPQKNDTTNILQIIGLTGLSIYTTFIIKYGLFTSMLKDLKFDFIRFFKYILYFTVGTVFFMTPLRVWGFITMLLNLSWGTRKEGYLQKDISSLKLSILRFIPTVSGIAFLLINILLVILI